MIPKFKPQEIRDNKVGSDPQVGKIFKEGDSQIENFHPRRIDKDSSWSYQQTKKSYGPLAITDLDRKKIKEGDRRFALNEYSKDLLYVNEEERRAIQAQIDKKIAEIRVEVEKKGYEEGFLKGSNDGQGKAYQEYKKSAQLLLGEMKSVLDDLDRKKAEIFKNYDKFLVELVFNISRMICLKEMETDPKFIFRLIEALVEKLDLRENIKIKINEKFQKSISSIEESLESVFGKLKNLSIECSKEVLTQGCLLESDWTTFDARIETELRNIYQALLPDREVNPSSEKTASDPSNKQG